MQNRLQNTRGSAPDTALSKQHIFLIGFMAVGKTTLAAELSSRLNRPRIDTDELVIQNAGMNIPDIFRHFGEAHFRRLEHSALAALIKAAPSVVSCGGGIVLLPENVALMHSLGIVVRLTATAETIWKRSCESSDRPLLPASTGAERLASIKTMLAEREEQYRAAAELAITTDDRSAGDICTEILSRCTELTAQKASSSQLKA